MKTIEEFYREAENIVRCFDAFVATHALAGKAGADHICYKCGSTESFESLRAMFEGESEYVFQSVISKRRIAIIRLKRGIETSLGTIVFLELSDQKPDGSQSDGFDHVEAYAVGRSYDDMVADLAASVEVVKIERPHHVTHDVDMGSGFTFRCTQGPLIDKIRDAEMA